MMLGHAAMTLVTVPDMPWWFLLANAFLTDIAMIAFVAIGIETMPPTGADGPSLATGMIDRNFSHDLLPPVVWASLAGAIAFAMMRSTRLRGRCHGAVPASLAG
ncbi:MAG: hypothetical protein V2I43_05030 [Parvularcula sp.]|jgi:hypothetical protein|nr:hypothetical protein [Parvularcula sp.]